MENKVNEVKFETTWLKERVATLEQYSRINNLIITNVPLLEKEKTGEVVNILASHLKLVIRDYDIQAVHWLPARNGLSAINVKFNKTEIIKAFTKCKLNNGMFKDLDTT